jgi:hypothetical protein
MVLQDALQREDTAGVSEMADLLCESWWKGTMSYEEVSNNCFCLLALRMSNLI